MTARTSINTTPAMTPSFKSLALLFILTLPGVGVATSLNEATSTLCVKIKSCATAQLQQQELPPAMLQMMTALFDETCANTITPYADKATNAGLEKKAVACIESINRLSCDTIMNHSGSETDECKALEKAAQQAGINTDIDAKEFELKP